MRWTHKTALAVAVTAALSAPAGAQIDATGIWHGVLQSPVGPLTLVLAVTADDDGTLAAHLESPDQAPGRQIPVTGLTLTGDHLAFTIP